MDRPRREDRPTFLRQCDSSPTPSVLLPPPAESDTTSRRRSRTVASSRSEPQVSGARALTQPD